MRLLIFGLCALLFAFSADAQSVGPTKKFALLVGVGDYAQPAQRAHQVTTLRGPKNDVALLKDLLVSQYGFPDDKDHIVTLVDAQATRAAITAAFNDHLVASAKKYKDSVVVFYFSGHGSQTPDLDGDESDGLDETILAYDSRIAGGRDIVDDEIDSWVSELRKYTGNITLIFDSCHSGTASRAIDVVARRVPPNPNMQSDTPTVPSRSVTPKDAAIAMASRDQQYVAIAGSLPEELSNEGDIPHGTSSVRHGFLTYYLVQALRREPQLTYRQAIRQAEAGVVRHVPSQHPQAEGDIDRAMFGGASDRHDPYVAIGSIVDSRTFTIEAGAIHGLREATILAVYPAEARVLSGEAGKLANARVVKVGDFESTAELLDVPANQLTKNAKVRIVTPNFGLHKMRVLLAEMPGQQITAGDRDLLGRVGAALNDNSLVESAESKAEWALSVQRGCMTPDRRLRTASAPAQAGACEPVYYLAPRDQDYSVFNLCTPAASTQEAAPRLAQAIEARAKQDNIRFLDNRVSNLQGKVRISFVKIDIQTVDGRPKVVAEVEKDISGLELVKIEESFQIRIRNQSERDLRVAVVSLGTSGSISLLSPVVNGELVRAGGVWTTRPLRAGPPTGLETLKVIATSSPNVNFSVLAAPVVTKSVDASPLEWVLNQSVTKGTRDVYAATGMDLDSWTTDKIDLLIESKGEAHGPVCRP